MAKIENFTDLKSWQKSREYCKGIYLNLSANKNPVYNQILRSSASIMDNIAEGFERGGNKEFIQFLSIAKASCSESRSQLYRCYDFKLLTEEQFKLLEKQSLEISKLIGGLIKYLKTSEMKGYKFSEPVEEYSSTSNIELQTSNFELQ